MEPLGRRYKISCLGYRLRVVPLAKTPGRNRFCWFGWQQRKPGDHVALHVFHISSPSPFLHSSSAPSCLSCVNGTSYHQKLLLSRQNDLFTVHVFKCSSISVLFHVVSNGSTLGNEFCPSAAAVEASSIAKHGVLKCAQNIRKVWWIVQKWYVPHWVLRCIST